MQKPIPTMNDPWVRWARLAGVLFVSATVLALVSGCGRAQGSAYPKDLMIFKDGETGCDYVGIGYNSAGGLTPRMNRDGKQVCK